MLKILSRERKTVAATMADRSTPSESLHDYDIVVDDLSEAWEFINPSTSDDDDEQDFCNFSFTEEDDTTDEVSLGPNKEEGPPEFGSPSSDISMESLPADFHHNPVAHVHLNDDDDDDEECDDENNDNDDDDEYDDGYDLDDELVPWGLGDKFGRQRLRKLGKRAGPRIYKANRLAYRYNKPGCVHGKHGFGVQHSYI